MIIERKTLAIVIVCLLLTNVIAQPQEKDPISQKQILYDVHGIPYTEVITTLENPEQYYYTLSGDTIVVKINKDIEFTGGRDSLRAFIADAYYKHRDPGNDELNVDITLRTLLDSNLRVIESRILQRGYNPGKYPTLDSVFIAIMNSTSGHWQKLDESDTSKYHIAGIVYRIY